MSKNVFGSRPSLSASTAPSHNPARLTAIIMLLAIFADCPAPGAAGMEHPARHHVDDFAYVGQILRVSTDHEGESAGLGAEDSAGHRRVEKAATSCA